MTDLDIDSHMDRIYRPTDEVMDQIWRLMPFGKIFHLSDGRLVKLVPFGKGPRKLEGEDTPSIGMDAKIYPSGTEDLAECASHIEFHLSLERTGGGGLTPEGAMGMINPIDQKETS